MEQILRRCRGVRAYGKLRNRIFREFFIQLSSPLQVGPFEVDEFMTIPGADECNIARIQAMLWVHFLREFMCEAFRADEFLDLFTLAVLGPHEGVFYFASTLLTPLGTGIPYFSVHIRF